MKNSVKKAERLIAVAMSMLASAQKELDKLQKESNVNVLEGNKETANPHSEETVVVNAKKAYVKPESKVKDKAITDLTHDEIEVLGNQILTKFNLDYKGKANFICLHYTQFNNGKDVAFLDRHHVTCEVYEDDKLLGSKYIHVANLNEFGILRASGLYTWNHNTYEPKKIWLEV